MSTTDNASQHDLVAEPWVGVAQVTVLDQVSVLLLSTAEGTPSVSAAVDRLDSASSRVVVIDCLDVDTLEMSVCAELVLARRQLKQDGRHLIVVNAPESVVARLRTHGVDVAATTDRVFVDDPRDHPDRDAREAAFHPARHPR